MDPKLTELLQSRLKASLIREAAAMQQLQVVTERSGLDAAGGERARAIAVRWSQRGRRRQRLTAALHAWRAAALAAAAPLPFSQPRAKGSSVTPGTPTSSTTRKMMRSTAAASPMMTSGGKAGAAGAAGAAP